MNFTFSWRMVALAAATAACALLAGCDELDSGPSRSLQPISSATLTQMDKLGTTASAPVLIRTYKQEAELEVWKQKTDGQYALLKTYPMCRWSGQLGPKTREGDRQVPEGFYPITPTQMNPNSNYYLSFNVGYPNVYDQAWGRTGGNIMVHGVCSSAGCFSMTDAQIAEIYAIAREAFNGGQREIQMQSYPFRMTSENLAKHRFDPNMAFWKELKNGSDHFEVTKAEPPVLVCDKHYVFGATADGSVDSREPCPALKRDESTEQAVAEKAAQDAAAVDKLVAQGVKAVQLVYQDGGSNLAFAGRTDVSRADALATAPLEIPMDAPAAAPTPALVRMASATIPPVTAPTPVAAAESAPVQPYAAAPATGLAALPGVGAISALLRPSDSNAVASIAPTALPSSVPTPPNRPAKVTLAANNAAPLDLGKLKPKAHKPVDPLIDPNAAQ
jgi:murein L,D-transpeptidase YafK